MAKLQPTSPLPPKVETLALAMMVYHGESTSKDEKQAELVVETEMSPARLLDFSIVQSWKRCI
jgi:hypothetical protein